MLEDFFFRALLGGIGVAIVAGPVGCFIIWRRLAYFGDTLSHSALLGVAMALLLELNITLSVFFISLIVSLLLLLLQKRASLSSDALLGLLAHATLAVGLVVLAFMTWVRVDLMGFLFGDILAITAEDLALIWVGGGLALVTLSIIWRSLFAATVSNDLALAEGIKTKLIIETTSTTFNIPSWLKSPLVVSLGMLFIKLIIRDSRLSGNPPEIFCSKTRLFS